MMVSAGVKTKTPSFHRNTTGIVHFPEGRSAGRMPMVKLMCGDKSPLFSHSSTLKQTDTDLSRHQEGKQRGKLPKKAAGQKCKPNKLSHTDFWDVCCTFVFIKFQRRETNSTISDSPKKCQGTIRKGFGWKLDRFFQP